MSNFLDWWTMDGCKVRVREAAKFAKKQGLEDIRVPDDVHWYGTNLAEAAFEAGVQSTKTTSEAEDWWDSAGGIKARTKGLGEMDDSDRGTSSNLVAYGREITEAAYWAGKRSDPKRPENIPR